MIKDENGAPPELKPICDFKSIPEDQRGLLSCDDTFALYLYEVSRKVNGMFYEKMLKFAILFRECLNEYGWKKMEEAQGEAQISPGGMPSDAIVFCDLNNAEHAPEICNEFITIFLDIFGTPLNKLEAIDITRNFCNWLFENGFTCSKLSMV